MDWISCRLNCEPLRASRPVLTQPSKQNGATTGSSESARASQDNRTVQIRTEPGCHTEPGGDSAASDVGEAALAGLKDFIGSDKNFRYFGIFSR